ncbi:hypothetical protein, partial [Aquibium sp. ELW1220]|uniref:hypothetical protein n=1 Tax=Aquibium sp. ELW1220 TaxID=2976766 RepID=UPI0025AECEB5
PDRSRSNVCSIDYASRRDDGAQLHIGSYVSAYGDRPEDDGGGAVHPGSPIVTAFASADRATEGRRGRSSLGGVDRRRGGVSAFSGRRPEHAEGADLVVLKRVSRKRAPVSGEHARESK